MRVGAQWGDGRRAISGPLATGPDGLSRSLADTPRRRSGRTTAPMAQIPKLIVRVRFPSPAPRQKPRPGGSPQDPPVASRPSGSCGIGSGASVASTRNCWRTDAAAGRARHPGDRPLAVPTVSRCRARQYHGQAVNVTPSAPGAERMSQPRAPERRTLSGSAPPASRAPEDRLNRSAETIFRTRP